MDHVGPDRQRAYHALRAVLHTLRDRLTVEEAAHLSAQLPLLVRGIPFEGWHPAHKPTKERSKEEFLDQIAARLRTSTDQPRDRARAALQVLERKTDRAEAAQVRHMLAKALQEIWPGELRASRVCRARDPGGRRGGL